MQSLMNYLIQYQLIPLKRAAEAIEDITGQTASKGTLVDASNKLHDTLKAPIDEIKQ